MTNNHGNNDKVPSQEKAQSSGAASAGELAEGVYQELGKNEEVGDKQNNSRSNMSNEEYGNKNGEAPTE
ncbi:MULTISPECIES: general stress protein B [Bacillaceae]|uniref:general stress protein B n=1 Tax=Bacillaceae TaxID=186817 RepID=UPI000E72A0AE|nr:general stress protein B [Bacillus sp. PK3_68]RJS59388.1 hypothetical protein CJ483_04320 [Bacillus sp. PK3_68]